MKLVDKIKEFENLEGLISEINSDKVTRDILSRRYPVRLIFLQKFETFRLLIERLSSIGVKNYHLEKDLPHPDGWITKDTLINIVKNEHLLYSKCLQLHEKIQCQMHSVFLRCRFWLLHRC
jgi:hypothetical protein